MLCVACSGRAAGEVKAVVELGEFLLWVPEVEGLRLIECGLPHCSTLNSRDEGFVWQ